VLCLKLIRYQETKKYFFPFGSFLIKDGLEIRFWEDRWLDNTTLREQYSSLYGIVCSKSDNITKLLESSPPYLTFKKYLVGPRLALWDFLLQRLALIHLRQGFNEFWWSLRESGKFTVDFTYRATIQQKLPVDNYKIWKTKITLWQKKLHVIFLEEWSLPKTTF
jgi:hypothetical protein